jgi:AbrB family looped-hinge helix DNA binding protein
MKSSVSSKGQVTIPIEIREYLGLKAGTPVVFQKHPQGALLRKSTSGTHPVDQVFGRLSATASVDVLLDEMRGPRPAQAQGKHRRPRPKRSRR